MPPRAARTRPDAIRWVVFDYGEVISRRSTVFPQLAALLGVELPALRDAYRSERDAYVLGASGRF